MVRLASAIAIIHATRKGHWVAMQMDVNCKHFTRILNVTAKNIGMDTGVNGTIAPVKMEETAWNVTQKHVAKIPFVHVPKDGKGVSAKVKFINIFLLINLFCSSGVQCETQDILWSVVEMELGQLYWQWRKNAHSEALVFGWIHHQRSQMLLRKTRILQTTQKNSRS